MKIKNYNEFIYESTSTGVRPILNTKLNEKQIRDYLTNIIDLKEYENFVIYPDLTVSAIHSDININEKLPIQFNTVRSFYVGNNTKIKNLIGTPNKVIESFDCSKVYITSLDGGPTYVGGTFQAHQTNIKNLISCPSHVGGAFLCYDCPITSLKGCPDRIPKEFNIWNTRITNLIGGPKVVGGNYICADCNLTSLEGAPEHIHGIFSCHGNKLKNFVYGPKIVDWDFNCSTMNNNSLISTDGIATKVGNIIDIAHNSNLSFDGFPIHLIPNISADLDADVRRNLFLYIDKILEQDESNFSLLGKWTNPDKWPGDIYEKWKWLFEFDYYTKSMKN